MLTSNQSPQAHAEKRYDPILDSRVQEHYTRQNLTEAILEALAATGKELHDMKLEDLAPVDEFHIRGFEATVELAKQLRLDGTKNVLDVGSGLGGASRYLASEFGCRVTGLDLTDEYCRVARFLANRLGLRSRVSYRKGSALEMPFDDESFEVVWTQHASMNIADKAKLYAEIARVLRPDGSFAMYDVLAGPVNPMYYPVPWARQPSISFLATPDQLRKLLRENGLEITHWRDTSKIGWAWFKEVVARMQQGGGSPALGFHLLLGPDFRTMAQNLVRNLEENRILLIECIARKMTD